jgi:nicotinamide-nucleotide amidase
MSKEDILHYSRQEQMFPLDPWFESTLDFLIDRGIYPDLNTLQDMGSKLEQGLTDYKQKFNINTAIIGLSGGVDSALTAAMLKSANWNVKAFILPIEQNPDETKRGIEVAKLLGISYEQIDLTNSFKRLLKDFSQFDNDIDSKENRLRRANLKVRLRMMTLYNMASSYSGLVASTDNFSELAAGFWTLHGDVGDLGPIQSLCKSWEVPRLAASYGIPDSTVRALPTDGLGISKGDEDQFGFSYLEFDIVLLTLCHSGMLLRNKNEIKEFLDFPNHLEAKVNTILLRIKNSVFKRNNPYNLAHPLFPNRLQGLKDLDKSIL